MLLLYPTLTVFVGIETSDQIGGTDFRIQPSSPVAQFSITSEMDYGNCDTGISESSGPWQGFISAALYRARFLNMAGTP